jgi:starch synthase (maltosyl-transferring)
MKGRIVIDDIHPRTPTGLYPAKSTVGAVIPVSADIFKDGHDVLAARVRWRVAGSRSARTAPMQLELNDRWQGEFRIDEPGMHEYVVEAWVDQFATWSHKLHAKLAAFQDVSVELQEGNLFFAQRASEATGKDNQARLNDVANLLIDESLDQTSRALSATTDDVAALVSAPGKTDNVTTSATQKLWVDRERAAFGAWYEAFPRSYGGFKGLTEHLQYVADMRFDVLYLPPIHPIGTSYRKGKNNTLDAGHDDVGSPWAIGNSDGGHTAIHADLGTIDDFRSLVAKAQEHGMEIALDYALQCSPDHPWVTEHPEWFHHRPDGTIAYAENPPKKYQDIYPINFWPEKETDRAALWQACKDILDYWISEGIRIFRVDNPHTKPIAFWAWLIPLIQRTNPEVVFLAEAFTAPKMMSKLAEIGFSQSYTYFTWRTAKWDLTEYLVEVALGEKSGYMRPNFWPNTPDILSGPLRNGPLSAFRQRLILAATMSANYGIYSGYELGENQYQSEANEEYLNSEKYEIKSRDFSAPHNLAPLIQQINDVRNRHNAFKDIRNIRFHGADNDQIICFSRRDSIDSDTVLIVVNIDPFNAQECTLNLDLDELGINWNEPFEAYDELSSRPFYWWGAHNYVRLTPDEPAHILHIRTNR